MNKVSEGPNAAEEPEKSTAAPDATGDLTDDLCGDLSAELSAGGQAPNPFPTDRAGRADDLNGLMRELLAAIERLEAKAEDDLLHCDACLKSRSAYTAFFADCELSGEFDSGRSTTLATLLRRILAALPGDETDDYVRSVAARLNDLLDYEREWKIRAEEQSELSESAKLLL